MVQSSVFVRWLVLGIISFALVGPAGSQDKNGPALKEFTSEAGKFAMKMPGTPKEHRQTVNGILNIAYILETGDGKTYAASFFELPPKLILTPDVSINAYAKGRKGTVISTKKVALEDEFPGRDAVIQLPGNDKYARLRIYVIQKRHFQLGIDGPKDFVSSAHADAFLDSFRRIK